MEVSKKKKKVCLVSAEDRATRGKLYLILALLGAVIYSLYCFAIIPLFNTLAVNYEIGLVDPIVLELARFGARLVDVLAVSLTGSIVIYAVYRLSAAKAVGGCLIFAGLDLYKFTASTVSEWIDSGYIPSDFLAQLLEAFVEAVLWILPFVAAFFIINAIIKGFKNPHAAMVVPETENADPVAKKGGFTCLLLSVMMLSLTVLIVNAGGQLIYDIMTLERITDPLLMLWDYLSHALLAVIGYSTSVLLIFVLDKCFGGEGNTLICCKKK